MLLQMYVLLQRRLLARVFLIFFFNDTATTEIYTLSLHDALPISSPAARSVRPSTTTWSATWPRRSEEHTSELQSQFHLVCRLLLEKKKEKNQIDAVYQIVAEPAPHTAQFGS